MSRNGAGLYSRAVSNYVYNTIIDQAAVNAEMDDIATALTNSLAKDGQTTPTANLPMGTYKLTGLGAGTSAGDSVRYEQATSAVAITGGTISGVPITQNSQSAAYTTVLTDAGKHILHPTADNNARTFTIDSNANVAYPVGTVISFINQINTVTIAITSDTLTLAGTSSTGSRTLAANGIATAIKITTTAWIISGTGLT